MTQTMEVIDREAQPVLWVHSQSSVFKIAKTLAGSFGKVNERLKSSGGESCGAPFARYSKINWEQVYSAGLLGQIKQMLTEKVIISAGMPVTGEATGGGDVEATEIPAGRYVHTIHTGPYHKVGDTYKQIVAFAKEQNLALQNWTVESYIDDPTTMPAAEVRTEVFVPLAD